MAKAKTKLKTAKTDKLSKRCYSRWKYSAERRGIEWDITFEYLQELFEEQGGKCAVTQVQLILVQNHTVDYKLQNASLDRINSKKGYVKGNVRFVTKAVNFLKGQLSDEELIEACKRVYIVATYKELMKE